LSTEIGRVTLVAMTTNEIQTPTTAAAAGGRTYDVVIVGGGAAGLSAALVLGRARRRVAVIDAGQPRNAPAAHMQGFLGSDGLPPAELIARGRAEVASYGVELIAGTVTAVAPSGIPPKSTSAQRRFQVTLSDGSVLETRAVLVTTGLRDEIPDVPGVRAAVGTRPPPLPVLPRL
jgi:thioredoxin reductase